MRMDPAWNFRALGCGLPLIFLVKNVDEVKQSTLMGEPGFRIIQTMAQIQLCDLDRPLPFSETQHLHCRANKAYLERLL